MSILESMSTSICVWLGIKADTARKESIMVSYICVISFTRYVFTAAFFPLPPPSFPPPFPFLSSLLSPLSFPLSLFFLPLPLSLAPSPSLSPSLPLSLSLSPSLPLSLSLSPSLPLSGVCNETTLCHNGGVCLNSEDGKDYTCQCLSGFTGENCTLAQLYTLEIVCVYPMPYYSCRLS